MNSKDLIVLMEKFAKNCNKDSYDTLLREGDISLLRNIFPYMSNEDNDEDNDDEDIC